MKHLDANKDNPIERIVEIIKKPWWEIFSWHHTR